MAGEKRNQEHEEETQRKETIVIVDIEGTTTSISFVKDTLFPYVRENLKDYVEKKWDDAEFKEDVAKLKEQAEKDTADKVEGLVSITGDKPEETKESLIKNILWQMDNDRKSGALKQLQGHMWRDAYKSGAVKGHVYEDVPKALEDWTKNGRKVYVYSSGSVEAQKLLFGNSEHGDLLKYFSGYFDTEVGPKQEASSYKSILAKIECDDASKVLFLTDVAKEAKAAVEAGITSVIVAREGNAALTAEEKTTYSTVKTFLDLAFQTSAKRQKLDSETDKEPKKTEETAVKASEPADAVEDVEMKDVSEKEVEKKPEVKSVAADEEKSKPVEETPVKSAEAPKEAMETETTTVATVEAEKSKPETEKVADDKTTKKTEEPAAVEPSTSDADKPEKDEKKSDEKSDIPVEDKDKKTEQSKSEPTTNLTENKTEQPEKVADAPNAETKMETEVDKKTETAVVEEKATKETTKTEETPKADEKKPEEVKEPAASKTETKEAEDKPIVEEVKQNGDSKPEKIESITTNGTATEAKTNGDSKETTAAPETKEPEKAVAENAKPEATEPEPVKSESVKEEEKTKDEVVEKKLNGSTPTTEKDDTTETTHRNGVNEETKQNGADESPVDKESIKVKKVVESIAADGAGEPDVVPPVAVVAATS
ncbi:enolase-phosphatase E1 [Microplitis demolitor]|uniref:enolase-phosphatase E1 n=1 Tax=Microplitis demolitor TaxID=69319 RepID=UPI0004CDA1A9|nr:enolase-phosphatase E1 [Microplitis demolitor]